MRAAAPVPFALIAGTCLALLSSLPARAGTAWLCNLSEDAVRLVCVADIDPLEPPPPAAPVAAVRGTGFPLDPRKIYTVDLWSPPTEPEWLDLLARSTLCYRSPGCTVTVAPVSWLVASTQRLRTASKR